MKIAHFASLSIFATALVGLPLARADKLASLKVSGSTHYNNAQMVAAIGVKPGSEISIDGLKDLANKLGATGAFSDIEYRYLPTPKGLVVEFTVADTTKFLPVRFDNFVWFNDDELQTYLKSHVPLYTGEVPVFGNLMESVRAELQGLLAERSLAGHVAYSLWQSELGRSFGAVRYRIADVNVGVHSIAFPGASPEFVPLLNQAAKQLLTSSFSSVQISEYADSALLDIYRERGYAEAHFQPLTTVLFDRSQPSVDVVLPVDAGPVFTLRSVSFEGNSALPASALVPLLSVKPGELANLVALKRDAQNMQKLYGRHGYLTSKLTGEPRLQPQSKALDYVVHVNEGEQFHMGRLTILGLDARSVSRLTSGWQLTSGSPFDADYPQQFMHKYANFFVGHGPISLKQMRAEGNAIDIEIDIGRSKTSPAPI